MSDKPTLEAVGQDDVMAAVPSPSAEPRERMAPARDYTEGVGLPSPEAWQQLKAEWTHDYGLRRMEDRGVRYENQKNRALDRAQDRAAAQPKPATPDPASRARFQKRDADRGIER